MYSANRNYTQLRNMAFPKSLKMKVKLPKQPVDTKAVTNAVSQVCDTTGAITLLDGIAPGTAINQRLGIKVTLDRLEGVLEMGVTSATGTDQYQRWAVVLDKQPNGSAAAITDVYENTSPAAAKNLANMHRFQILKEVLLPLNASAEPGSKRTFKVSIPLNSNVIFNAGNAGTVADIVTNAVYLITTGSNVAGATAGSAGGTLRIWYHNSV
jgi:hypothetical protein